MDLSFSVPEKRGLLDCFQSYVCSGRPLTDVPMESKRWIHPCHVKTFGILCC